MATSESITLQVDGKTLTAQPGQMLIEVTDQAGVNVPRFCYHKHLSVAANCRMCLVEVKGTPKPLPACATPCADGMEVATQSALAREAQQGTMEFLLINHPLDCPICDQGGECELQDVAMGYGGDVSRYTERKRVVQDEDIGSLIATDMTRCIHCTRCVRFGSEIAGLRELGATGRGEHTRIGTYIAQSVGSELSGNVIDLCPVGALTSKPYRYTARSWELTQAETIAPHDGIGSSLYLHLRRNQIMRVVPKENPDCHQTWISDRDRFAYTGINHPDRLKQPLIRDNGTLRAASWQEALQQAANLIRATQAERLGLLASPNATLEELYLSRQLMTGLGSPNIDHRLRQTDFRDDAAEPAHPWLGCRIAELEQNDVTLLIGSWLRKDQPLLNHRVHQSVRAGGQVIAVNPVDYDHNYPLALNLVVPPADMACELAGIAQGLGANTEGLVTTVSKKHQQAADQLKAAQQGSILLGTAAQMHPDYALLRRLAAHIAEAAGLTWGQVGFGSNDLGARVAGAVPTAGQNAAQMQQGGCDTLILLGLEPEADVADPQQTAQALNQAQVVALSAYRSPLLEQTADVILPMGVSTETSGTFINLQGDAQSFAGATPPPGEARPGWKVLRVLGNTLELTSFDYQDSISIRDEALQHQPSTLPDNRLGQDRDTLQPQTNADGWQRIGGVPIYATDATVRRAAPLQATPDAWDDTVRLNPRMLTEHHLSSGATVRLTQGEYSTILTICSDDRVPDGCVWYPSGLPRSAQLGASFASVGLESV
ncbi:MAG: NADH-quinone oxidoreductase subunit NuoG [Pseudomonadota bacterium]